MEQVLKSLTLEFFGSGAHKITPEKLFENKAAVLLDVRSREEAASVSINLSKHDNIECRNIPVDEIPDRWEELPKDRLIAVFCPANVRSSIVYAFLLTKGLEPVKVLEGGYAAITEAVKPGRLLKHL
ncbi:MAG: rhodanese-like domain-containing protein [Desulfobacterales bacterium]|nr:rhodanese-like domain-containing protein [Desulfobacterales bacterium]